MDSTERIAVLFGHSHLGALIDATSKRRQRQPAERPPLHVRIMQVWRYGGTIPYVVESEGRRVFNPVFLRASGALDKEPGLASFVTAFGGNAHNTIAIVQLSKPFDFMFPGEEHEALAPGAELLPFFFVESSVRGLVQPYLDELSALRDATDQPMFALESPPPLEDATFIADHLDRFFVAQFANPVISNAGLRLKMWRLQCRLYREHCKRIGITSVPAPAETVTSTGFLEPSFYGSDATHANLAYGERVLRQVEDLTGTAFFTWSPFSE